MAIKGSQEIWTFGWQTLSEIVRIFAKRYPNWEIGDRNSGD